MILTNKESKEVLYSAEGIVKLSLSDINSLKEMAVLNPQKKIRLCAHRGINDSLHEMFIIHTKNYYVRPHKHIGKAESMSVLEGEVDFVLFEEDGTVSQVIEMSSYGSGKKFFNRIDSPIYHMLIIKSEFLVFHEVTEGPLLREKTIFPDWAPKEDDPKINKFKTNLLNKIEKIKKQ